MNPDTPKTSVTIETVEKADRLTHPARSLVFETERQRNVAFLNKGISKPGRITYDVLRRAAQSVHIARICINVLKEKITKTKWIIKPIDPQQKIEGDDRIAKLTELFKHPNRNDETFRTLLDKMLEDLLVLDAVSLEKTRYENGDLAELHFVDSATIRPVFDEHGNQDVIIPLYTEGGPENLPVSYVQVLNNSQYGGPESGEIVAAWPKKDFLFFHMHPQGAMESIGYGLSPLEGVLSVVANILNADNYNGTYFEEGSFPPVIIQILGQVNQRDIEQYREYLQSELMGNFHRPAIMAGGTEAKVLNLKDLSNRDMEFMEYMKFMARLLAAAYGLSSDDIGLTEDTGSKNVAETNMTLSNQKGYSSVLHLIKEVFNQEVIWKDFGFDDLEFDWVAEDSTNEKDKADLSKTSLESGIMTINEARRKMGLEPYGPWADNPMVLTASGYVPIVAATEEAGESQANKDSEKANFPKQDNKKVEKPEKGSKDGKPSDTVGNERNYNEQEETPDKPVNKSWRQKIVEQIKSSFSDFPKI